MLHCCNYARSLLDFLIAGCAVTCPGTVTLDFAAGLIRHAATVDDDGAEWSHEVVQQLGVARSSSSGRFFGQDSWFYIIGIIIIITNN